MEMTKEFKVLDTLFSGMIIQSTRRLFSDFKEHMKPVDHIEFVEVTHHNLHMMYKGTLLVTIDREDKGNGIVNILVTLYPGLFLDRNKSVFRTLNRVLSFYSPTRFIKSVKGRWTLCEQV
jgi:hypothetical protein